MAVKRGEIYWVELDPMKGGEPGGTRPALVVQNDVGNRFSPTTIIVAITRTVPPQPYPFVVIISPDESHLPDLGVANCSQLATIQQSGPQTRLRPPRGETTVRPIGQLSAEKMRQVDEALLYSLGIHA
jgi:mRNA interferase MazF